MQYTKTVRLDINDIEVSAVLTFYYTPGIRGVYDALPEDCFPEKSEEWELVTLRTESGDDCDWMIPYIADSLIEQLGE
jgi:hypothetical protein